MSLPLQQPDPTHEPTAEQPDLAVVSASEASDLSGPDMLARVTELYFLTEEKRTEDETNSFGLVLEKLAYASAVENRARLANRLSFSPKAPVRLMRRMAFDTIIVARPVLQYSPALSEDDLETLAKKLGQDHLLAIAHRLYLPSRITDVLVERGVSPVRVTLTNNSSAEFSTEAIARLMELSETDPELKFALGTRPDLSPPLFERFRSFVVGQFFIEGDAEDGEVADEAEPAAEEARDEAADQASGNSGGDDRDLSDDDEGVIASEHILANLASAGKAAEAVVCMAKLTRLEDHMIEHCLFKAEPSALMVLCKANNFSTTTFKALLNVRQNQSPDLKVDLPAQLKRYEAMNAHTAKRIIQYADKSKT